MYLSSAAENAALGALVGDDNVTAATLYFGVCDTEPTITDGVISVTGEPTNGGYARVAVTNDGSNFSIADGVAENVNEISFPDSTAAWNKDAAFCFVSTAATGGTVLWYGELSGAPVAVASGVTLRLPAGTATITVS